MFMEPRKKKKKKNRNVFRVVGREDQENQDYFSLNELRHFICRPSQGSEEDVFSRERGQSLERGALLNELLSEIVPVGG